MKRLNLIDRISAGIRAAALARVASVQQKCSALRHRRAALVVTALLAAGALPACSPASEIVLASYNVENLFDAVYDGTEYSSFDPRGDEWGPNRYARSLENTVRVIGELGGGDGADILALQEIENARVLFDLAGELSRKGYRHKLLVANDGPFHNAIFSRVPVVAARAHALGLPWTAPGRYILEADLDWGDRRIRLLVNHWHSKVRGDRETEPSRRQAAAIVARRVRRSAEEGIPTIVAGDLNLSADEYRRRAGEYPTALLPVDSIGRYDPLRSLFLTTRPRNATVSSEDAVVLYSPWKAAYTADSPGGMQPPGTYVFRGRWKSLDHIMFGPGFVTGVPEAGSESPNSGGAIGIGEFRVVAEPYMLDSRGAPRRWRSHIAHGYSDHLPVEVTLHR